MRSSRPARTAAHRAPSTALAVLAVVGSALIGALGYQSLAPSSPSLASPSLTRGSPAASPPSATVPTADEPEHRPPDRPPGDRHGALGAADGVVPDGVTVFDDAIPAVANLDPVFLGALRRAATAAAGEGVELSVTSGWRSPAYQEQLLREAVAEHGSEAEAARWVATPTTSAHVSGDAVDVGSAAATWLSEHGAGYGLCQVYDNEPWHYELRPDAIEHGCPARYADPTDDPRMEQ